MDTRELFIIELMVFSPKYNAVLADQIASQMTEDQLKEAYERLSKINEAREEELAALEDRDPEAYERHVQERERVEQETDRQYFDMLEQQMLADTDGEESHVEEVQRQMDLLAQDAQQQITADYDTAEDLVKNLFDEISAAGAAQQ